jgi:hypothetical protein
MDNTRVLLIIYLSNYIEGDIIDLEEGLREVILMDKDRKYFNCSQKHEVDYLASKFNGSKAEITAKIKELCKSKVIHYSTHREAEQALIDAGFTKK